MIGQGIPAEGLLSNLVTLWKKILRQRNLCCAEREMGAQSLMRGGSTGTRSRRDDMGALFALDEIAKKVWHPWAEDREPMREVIVVDVVSS